jgi:outer membrane protein TolC
MLPALPLLLALSVQDPGPAPDAVPVPAAAQVEGARLLGPGRGLELTLEGAWQIALLRNPSLAVRETQAQVARLRSQGTWGAFDWVLGANTGARDAEFQPTNVFGGSREKSAEVGIDFTRPLETGGRFVAQFDGSYQDTDSDFEVEPVSYTDVVAFSYVQPLLRGAWSEYATTDQRLAELDAARAQEGLLAARNQLLLDVANAYWDLVSAREQLDVADKSLELSQAQVDQNRRRLDAGLGTEVEVLQAQADVANREEQRLLREFDLRAATDALRRLLFPGTDQALWDTALVPATLLPEEATAEGAPAWAAAMRVALERRPELREQRLRIDQAEVRHKRSQVDKRPRLDLDLSASAQGFSPEASEALDTAFTFDYPTYRAALTFQYALGNTTARYAEKAFWAEIRTERLTYDDLETGIVADVRAAVREVLYSVEAVRAARKSLELATRQLEAEQARYAVDQSTNFQVLEFQTDLATALSNERRARVAYVKSLVRLQAAQGVLGDGLAP